MIDTVLAWSIETWVAIFAAFVACVSAALSYRSSTIAREHLAIHKQTWEGARPNAAIHLIDSFRYRAVNSQQDFYVHCLSIENKSSEQNSVVGVEMRLPIIRGDIESVAVFAPTYEMPKDEPLEVRGLQRLPLYLSGRGATAVNFCFAVSRDLLVGAEAGSHMLRVRYAEGQSSDVNIRLIMDVVDVQHLEKKRERGVPV